MSDDIWATPDEKLNQTLTELAISMGKMQEAMIKMAEVLAELRK